MRNIPPLNELAIYLSPLGRRCKYEPLPGQARTEEPRLNFRYMDTPIDRPAGDGFCLSWRNRGILTLWSAEHASAR